jgi:hypothetical protein
MKKIMVASTLFLLFLSCNDNVVKEPKLLIDRDVMVTIMYDISILDASKYQSSTSPEFKEINANQYILKKYKIDSIQFAQSNVFYASDYKEYKKMLEQVKNRLVLEQSKIDSLIKRADKKELLTIKKRVEKDTLKAKVSLDRTKNQSRATDFIEK